MKRLFLLSVLALFCTTSFSQSQSKVDSLHQVYDNSANIDVKVNALKQLFWSYYFTQPENALTYAHKMDSLASANNDNLGKWTAYNLVGIYNFSRSQFDSARFWFNKGFSLSYDDKYYDQFIYSLNYSGHSYRLQSEYEKADSCFLLFVEIAKKVNDNYNLARAYKGIAINNYTKEDYSFALENYLIADSLFSDTLHYETAEVLQNIGLIYKAVGNYKLAKNYNVEALSMYEAINDNYGIYAIERSLGSLELSSGNYEVAEKHLKKAFSYYKDFNDQLMAATVAELLGTVYLKLENTKLAEQYFRYAINHIKGIEIRQISDVYRGLGDTYKAKGVLSEAMIYYDSSLFYAKKSNSAAAIRDALAAKAQVYHAIGEYAKAYNFQQQYHHLSDSLNETENSKAIHEIEAKYQNDKKEREITLLTTQNQLAEQEKQNQMYLLLSIVLITFIAAIFFFVLYRNRQKMAAKLQELDTAKSNFFANISHEFRTPLTLIKSPVESWMANENLDAKERESLSMINRNADRLLSLVDQLLDLSKLESGQMSLQISRGNVLCDMRAMASNFEYLAEKKQIAFSYKIPDTPEAVWYDQDVVEKITVNLFSNAVKYTPEGGKIAIVVTVDQGLLTLKVENTGQGIVEKDIAKILDRFYQSNTSQEGVGIGLALVNELVTLHKGVINFDSKQNESTVFSVELPVSKEVFAASDLAENAIAERKQIKLNHIVDGEHPDQDTENEEALANAPLMLVVDDNADIRSVVKNLFQEEYKVLEAADGKEGIDIALKTIPDIIISDVMMPHIDGVELSNTLKEDERTSHIPVILLTAKAGEANEIEGLETGADDYVVKPFRNEVLKVRVRKLVELREKLRQRYTQELVLKPREVAVTPVDEKFLKRVQNILDEKITDPEFSAQLFSREIGMSRMQLHRKLKSVVGYSTSELIKTHRMKLAAQILQNEGVNMSEVAYAVGFSDPSYFSKCFKEFYGDSPSEYAKSHLEA